MNTIKGSSVWLYFFKTDDPSRVKCKLCKSVLRSARKFNLKQHLKRGHKIEVRLRGRKRNETDQDFIKAEFMEENDANTTEVVNEALESNEHILSDSIPPLIPFSTGIPQVLKNKNEIVEPRKNDNEQIFIDGTLYQVKQKKRAYKPKNVPISSDTTLVDDQPPPSPKKEDNFDEVFRKRKQLTELEYLQMQNYKMKLELWAMERKLHVKSSKYTKDIEGLPSTPS